MEQLILSGRILPGNTLRHRAHRWFPPRILLLLVLLLHKKRRLPELLGLPHRRAPERGTKPSATLGSVAGARGAAGVVDEGAGDRLVGAGGAARAADECAGHGLAGAGGTTGAADECAGGGFPRAGGAAGAGGAVYHEGGVRVDLGGTGAGAAQIQERGSGGGRGGGGGAALDDDGGGERGVVEVRRVGVVVLVEGGSAAEVLGEALEERGQRRRVLLLVILREGMAAAAAAAAGVVVVVVPVDDDGGVHVGLPGARPRRARGEGHGRATRGGAEEEDGERARWKGGEREKKNGEISLVGASSLESSGLGPNGPLVVWARFAELGSSSSSQLDHVEREKIRVFFSFGGEI